MLKEEKNNRKQYLQKEKDKNEKIEKYYSKVGELEKEICNLNNIINEKDIIINNKSDYIRELELNLDTQKNNYNSLIAKNNKLKSDHKKLNKEKKRQDEKISKKILLNSGLRGYINKNNIYILTNVIKEKDRLYKELLIKYNDLLYLLDKENESININKEMKKYKNLKEDITGYISKNNKGECIFISDDINIPMGKLSIPDGIPAKVSRCKNGEYMISKLYEPELNKNVGISNINKKSIRRNKLVEKLKNKYSDFNTDKKILIIGNKFRNIYLRGLKGLGLNVDWFSINDSTIFRMYSMLDKYDIIIVCMSHVGHNIVNALDSTNRNNIFKIKNDTFDKIIYKINYALENLD